MDSKSLLEAYEQYYIPQALKALQSLVGHPLNIGTDEALFRQVVIDPGWNSLPLPLRLIDRAEVRWDEYLLASRKEVLTNAQGQLALRSDAPLRLLSMAQRLFSAAASPPPPAAVPVAKRSTPPPLPPAAAPQAPAAPPPRPSAPPPAPAVRSTLPATPATTLPAPAQPLRRPASAPAQAAEPQRPADALEKQVAVGIDLGTTYSVIAYVDAHGRPCSVPNAVGDLITPSVILLDESGPIVGKEAVQAAAMEPEKIADVVKRDMGSKWYRKKINGEHLPPEVLSSLILRALKADAERKLGPVNKAVITVPAYFDEARRRATMDAGKLAGLDVLDIINEPTAAAIAYGYQVGFLDTTGRSQSDRPLRVLVYDLGGGTFDVTIVEIKGTSFKALATDGDVALGGKDWDEKLVQIAAESFRREHREDPLQNPVTVQELWIAAEVAKKTLSERSKATIYVNHLGVRHKVEVSRQEFDEATAHLLGRTRTTTEIVVRQAGLRWSDIDKVLLVGGSTRMPVVPRMLEEITGKPPERSVSPDEAVAHGAALYAQLLQQQQSKNVAPPSFSVTNVNSHSLGIVGVDPATGRKRNQVLIPKNTPLPHTVSGVFKTHKANQANVTIRIVEGESERPEACVSVGTVTVAPLPPNLPAGWPVHISYAYSPNGRLQVTALLKGQQTSATTTFQRENSLAEEDMRMWEKFVSGKPVR